MSTRPAPFAICVCLVVSGLNAFAATPTVSFGVTATVQATCAVSVSAATPGPYSTAGTKATAAVSVTCSHAIPYTVGLSDGLGIEASMTTPKMAGADSALPRYAVARARDGSAQVLTAVGELSPGQYVGTGLFAGSIIVTVTY
jgi:spore coat protein U-like protein